MGAPHFRIWVTKKWYEYRTEIFSWTGKYPDITAEQYFQQHKWYLKNKYKRS